MHRLNLGVLQADRKRQKPTRRWQQTLRPRDRQSKFARAANIIFLVLPTFASLTTCTFPQKFVFDIRRVICKALSVPWTDAELPDVSGNVGALCFLACNSFVTLFICIPVTLDIRKPFVSSPHAADRGRAQVAAERNSRDACCAGQRGQRCCTQKQRGKHDSRLLGKHGLVASEEKKLGHFRTTDRYIVFFLLSDCNEQVCQHRRHALHLLQSACAAGSNAAAADGRYTGCAFSFLCESLISSTMRR